MKLFHSPSQANYAQQRAGNAFAIENLSWKQFMWLDTQSPCVSPKCDPAKRSVQWLIEGLPTGALDEQ